MRNSVLAKTFAVVLLVLMPMQGAFTQTASDSSSSTPAPADTNAAPVQPAAPAADSDTNSSPVSDMTTPGAAASPAQSADNSQPAVEPGKKNKKIVGSPDTEAAQSGQAGPIVREINIEYIGPKTVSKSVILSNMRTSVGDVYSAASVEEDVRNLYATGFFTNLAIKDEPLGDGVQVNVVVQPKPLVKEIVITGAQKIKVARLKKEIKSKIGETLSEQQISSDADKIKDYYLSKGYSQVQVSYKIDTNEEFGRSVVTFIVSEGEQAYVTEVDFVGNDHLTTKELRKIMKTRKKNLFSFINKSGLFKEDDFKQDLNNLRDYYYSKGYIDMEVKDVKFDYPEKKQMKVVITVFEGIQYTVGKIDFDGNSIFTKQELRTYRNFKVIRMDEGKVYSPRAYTPQGKDPNKELPTLENDIQRITDLYGSRGYIDFPIVTPERQANVESGKIDILYHIKEGSQSYVDQIIIQGNNRTKDKVIRRELLVSPGQLYDSVRVDTSKKRLENLQYFEKVDISPQDTNVPNRKNMVVTVEEKRTGSITFGAGFSSVDSLLGFVEITQGNFDLFNYPYFTGGGEKFRVRLQYGLERQDAEIEFKEPWFLEQRLSLGYDLFYHNATYLSTYYDERNYGASVSLAKAFSPFWSGSVTYTLQEYDLYNFSSSASPQLLREQGYRSDSSITLGLAYDTRDSVLLTRNGMHADFSAEFAGGPLWGQTNIYKFQADAQKYILLPYDMILMVAGATGVADYFGNSTEVPLFDRFFIGGSRSVRGFGNRDIGPVDVNNEPLGGNTMAYNNIELTFPIIDRVRGAVFNDMGFLDARSFHYTDAWTELNMAAGVGLRLNLPIGPLRLDYGIPYKDQGWNHSNTGKFSFDVGYQF
ncbi:MAG: outer membrane protein assembly factor BamA [Methylacidiphilales bacterium]|nr:outer membrane protein assembly factor BamA [Candidatus Methylacidiphilales bacterium]